ncbi:helix-turn-helix transcriptional regulator [Mycobacterium sp. ITM-2016-00316]|uniref:helix-turn-helix domain-containing protein n=1 Tax=Mycobacterium sp. ITM-2016-00316 TaxID=2099695 RepID=UPI00115BE42B|nr:helix-turn-helix transcriptional regulator [Mycobacterium sp. ITM-2016-00316]WNG84301.1 helix-turn-helix transcriptional regulator [Mycobacterium sp. ITM-2016-00316]
MSDWFNATPSSERLLSEERLILSATEQVHEALHCADVPKKVLAERLGVSKSEIGQRLSGRRNLTVRSLAAMLHALGYEATLSIRPVTKAHELPRDDLMTFKQRRKTPLAHPSYRTTRVRPMTVKSEAPEMVAG